MGRRVRRFTLVLLWILAVLSLPLLHAQEDEGLIAELKLFSKAIGAIWEAYPGNLNPRELLYQAVKGMLGSLDKYSEFIDLQRYQLLQISMRGEYAGIGVILKMAGPQVAISAVEPGKPGEKAGLLADDIILKIDGISMEKKTIPDVASLLRGDANTPVVVTVLREPSHQILDIKIQRQKIEIQAIQDAHRIGKSLAYMRIAAWQENTTDQADKTLKDLKKKGMKALIIDLRNNDGGLMTQAVSLAERFLPKGKKILSVQSKIEEQRKDYFSSYEKGSTQLPLVILVNQKTASASEVFSGALQDHRRATIVGVQTFGKGSVQSIIPLDGVSGMKLTTARYVTPAEKVIDGVGLTPDRVVENGPAGTPGEDRQILEATEILKKYT
ncbi:MAG: S41 family peptidase [Candidatus Omnitrophota bacterium]